MIPVVLDMGTDNLALLNDEMYIGNRHARVRDQRYDDLIDAYVNAATKLFPTPCCTGRISAPATPAHPEQVRRPGVHVQRRHAGHAAVVMAAAFAAVKAAGSAMRDQRVVIHGAGTAGIGIADMMRDQMVREGLAGGSHSPNLGTGHPGPAD